MFIFEKIFKKSNLKKIQIKNIQIYRMLESENYLKLKNIQN
jgi:hypothetical protein